MTETTVVRITEQVNTGIEQLVVNLSVPGKGVLSKSKVIALLVKEKLSSIGVPHISGANHDISQNEISQQENISHH